MPTKARKCSHALFQQREKKHNGRISYACFYFPCAAITLDTLINNTRDVAIETVKYQNLVENSLGFNSDGAANHFEVFSIKFRIIFEKSQNSLGFDLNQVAIYFKRLFDVFLNNLEKKRFGLEREKCCPGKPETPRGLPTFVRWRKTHWDDRSSPCSCARASPFSSKYIFSYITRIGTITDIFFFCCHVHTDLAD